MSYINILNKWKLCIVQCIKHILIINKQFNLEKINYEYEKFILILKSIKFEQIVSIFEYEYIYILLKNFFRKPHLNQDQFRRFNFGYSLN
jgi:hypothetical protein